MGSLNFFFLSFFLSPIEWKDGVPLWEKKFCSFVGTIPWGKIVDTKNFMFCHKNILSWDDSAGEEAFQNAKKRFWARINDLPCDIPLPDPDIYIDEIDWNTNIDPELIKELDREYFAPDEEEGNTNVGYKNKRIKNSVSVPSEGYMNQENNDNPWGCNNVQDIGALENKAQGWNQWEDNKNDDNNPWEHSFTQGNGSMMDNTWGKCRDKLWGLNQGANYVNRWDNGDNPWERGCQGVASVKDKGWGDFGNKGWGFNQQEPKNNGDNPRDGRFRRNIGAFKNRGSRDCGGNGWGGKRWDKTNNDLKHQEFSRTGGGRGTWNESSRKKGSSHPYITGTESYRFQENNYQTGQTWRRGQTRKRVSFSPGYQ